MGARRRAIPEADETTLPELRKGHETVVEAGLFGGVLSGAGGKSSVTTREQIVVSLDDRRPHDFEPIQCKGCGHRWVAVFPAGLTFLECPGCHDAVNLFGVPVLVRRCVECKSRFTVCPKPADPEGWEHCLGEHCSTYDPDRDGDRLVEIGLVRQKEDE